MMDNAELDDILSLLWDCKLPNKEDAIRLLQYGETVLEKEPNILQLNGPITVCGDIHGQFYDLLELFSVGGRPPEQNFIFLGDYVDRGFYSTETFFLLLALKCRYPTKMYMIRGNHECRQITMDYGFADEVLRKYDDKNHAVYNACIETFNALPLAAVIDKKILCVHGGLSPSWNQLSDLEKINRKNEPPETGIFSDILWSDPNETKMGFQQSERGAGFLFGRDVTEKFLKKNDLKFICRAHQVAMEGYQKFFDGALYTVWSAPNYCYRGANLATVFEITNPDKSKFKPFKEAPACARGKIPEQKLPQYFV